MTTKIDDFIKKVESTAEEDLFTPRTFYSLSSSMFHEMCELLKEQENTEVKEKTIMDKWISVDERLPDKEGVYAVYQQWRVRDVNRHLEFVDSDVDVTWYSKLSGFGDDTVTHWLPLPEPPEITR